MLSFFKSLSPVNLKIVGILASVLAVAGAMFYFYFTYSQDKIAGLNEKVATQEVKNKVLEEDNKKIKENVAKQANNLNNLSTEVNKIKKETSQLGQTLSRHDFDYLVKKKPGLMEKRINNGTKKVFKDIEEITQ